MKIVSATVDDHHKIDLENHPQKTPDILKIDESTYHIIHDSKSIKIDIIQSDILNKTYKLRLNHKIYNIQLESDLDVLIEQLGLTTDQAKSIDKIVAPMPGLILQIMAEEGNEVNEDEPLLILEAMKMENVILSPKSGIIKSVAVKTGKTVDKNDLLIEFEE
ncbi:acetyl-CoA carboxylase biotin carboxyl carrier protein subunit [Aegicerativicinus sediminis]|uniref:acetyl-CoA carboxylase biotin carboxyl carrier protein subunit n=1 Tax=Aegicerativicinus sediminis TaxID=2893202 RepID=UPI001E571D10|nr:acetyl-CoA carboxylase biotin carboxyl carrier protein subunit [Aegicerativicinus sediminis]